MIRSPLQISPPDSWLSRGVTLFGGLRLTTSPGVTPGYVPHVLIRPKLQQSHSATSSLPHTTLILKLMRFLSEYEKLSLYLEDCLQDYMEIKQAAHFQ